MDQSGSYLEKFKKAQEQAAQSAAQGQPAPAPQGQPAAQAPSAAEIFRQKQQKAEAVNKFMGEMRAQEAAKAKPVTDYSKAVGSGAQEAALSVPGMFGDIPQGVVSAVTALPTYAVPYVSKKLGFPISEEKKKGLEAGREAVLGTFSKFTPPTTEQYGKMVEPYAEKAFGVGPLYQPQTPQEAMAKQGVSLGLQSAMGKPQGVFKRMLSGSTAGAASEGLGQALESSDYASLAPYARLGALTTLPYALEKFPVSQAGRIAEGYLAPSLAAKKDIAAGVGNFGAKSKLVTHQMARGENVSQVAAKTPDRIRQFNQEITGIAPDSAEFKDLMERVGRVERDRVFDLARANPNADAIDVSGLGDLQNHPIFQQAETAARKNAINDPYNQTIAPQVVPGQPAQTLHGPQGLYTVPATPPQQVNGNLSFYQGVKEELDVVIRKANAEGDWRTAAKAQDIKNKLISTIDPQVPEYKTALNESRLTYGMEQAPEAGAKFFETYNTFKDYDFKKSFDAYSRDEQDAFRVGFLGRLEQDINQGRDQALQLFVKNPAFQKKVEYVFGPQLAGEIRAKYLSEAMIKKAAQLDDTMASNAAVGKFEKLYRKSIPAAAAIGAGAAAEAVQSQFLAQMLSQLNVSPVTVAATIGVFGATVAGRGLLKGAEQRIANRMVQLVKEGDAASYAKLNKLIDKYPEVYPKIMTLLETARTSTELYGLPKEEKPAALPQETMEQTYERLVKEGKIQPVRADGGRVARADGGRIDVLRGVRALMRAAENAKKNISKNTETLLEQPDEHIAQALDMAKKHI